MAPIIPTDISIALEFAIIGTIESYSIAEGFGFVRQALHIKIRNLLLIRIG